MQASATATARQNRVDPRGRLIADRARGSMMGNRGVLHDAEGRIRRSFELKRWIICRLEFRGRRRQIMRAGHYTELFFLDEATAFAAGHRPCAECQRERYEEFRGAWIEANRTAAERAEPVRAGDLDAALHRERIGADGGKVTFEANWGDLPDGVLVLRGARPELAEPELRWDGTPRTWRASGYGLPGSAEPSEAVTVLTPRSAVNAFAAGFRPAVALT